MLFKRALILVLTLITAVSLIGCGSSQAPAADTPATTETGHHRAGQRADPRSRS